ncbi:MAG: hypothetical protein NTZ73_02240 [Candidatus Diapherotrites archaeon]|nr:hypothetical protein [Candidatus Diapherotrites archaeon]
MPIYITESELTALKSIDLSDSCGKGYRLNIAEGIHKHDPSLRVFEFEFVFPQRKENMGIYGYGRKNYFTIANIYPEDGYANKMQGVRALIKFMPHVFSHLKTRGVSTVRIETHQAMARILKEKIGMRSKGIGKARMVPKVGKRVRPRSVKVYSVYSAIKRI